jgi:hypothetical protein
MAIITGLGWRVRRVGEDLGKATPGPREQFVEVRCSRSLIERTLVETGPGRSLRGGADDAESHQTSVHAAATTG